MGKWLSKAGYETCLQAAGDQLNAAGMEIHLIRFHAGKFRHYHKRTTEFFHFTAGRGRVLLEDREVSLTPGASLIIQPLTVHTFINDSSTDPLEAVMIKTNTDPTDTYPVEAMPYI